MIPSTYSDEIYTTFRDTLLDNTDLTEAFDVIDIKSGGSTSLDKSFIINIVRERYPEASIVNENDNYYIWDIIVNVVIARGNITATGGYSTDKNTILAYDKQVENAFYKALDILTGIESLNIVSSNYVRSTNPKRLSTDSNDYITIDVFFRLEGYGQKLF